MFVENKVVYSLYDFSTPTSCQSWLSARARKTIGRFQKFGGHVTPRSRSRLARADARLKRSGMAVFVALRIVKAPISFLAEWCSDRAQIQRKSRANLALTLCDERSGENTARRAVFARTRHCAGDSDSRTLTAISAFWTIQPLERMDENTWKVLVIAFESAKRTRRSTSSTDSCRARGNLPQFFPTSAWRLRNCRRGRRSPEQVTPSIFSGAIL